MTPGSTPQEAVAGGGSITVVVADDDADVLDTFADLVRKDSTLRLVGTASDAAAAVALVGEHHPDVAVLDVRMPGGGATAASQIRRVSPRTRVLACSAHDDRSAVTEMLRSGVSGYVVKGVPRREFVAAVHAVARGETALSPQISSRVVSELVTLLNDSARMADELAAMNRTSNDLIHVLSHELLTPLTIVQGTVTTLQKLGGRLTDGEAEEMVASAARAGERLRRLVANVALAARLNGAADIERRSSRVRDLLRTSLEEFPTDRHRIETNGALEERIIADPLAAPRAVSMVLENALAFGPADEAIEVTVRLDDAFVRIEVADRGPGIAPEIRDAVLHPLVQGESSTTRSHEGLGIGLFLARRVMQVHGGDVRLDDRAGGGTTVTLAFPRS